MRRSPLTVTETRFLLSGINNPNAPMRANGIRWWGYPSRNERPRVIVVHTAESTPSGSSARSVGEWQSRAPVPSSYHVLCDSTTTLRTVRDDHTAFHAAGFNSISLGISWATRASLWGTYPDWDGRALARSAEVCRRWQNLYDIPAVWLTRPQVQAGARGFVRHSTLDPARRSDPGLKFPAGRFFALLDDGDDMPLSDSDIERIWSYRYRDVRQDNVLFWARSHASTARNEVRALRAEVQELAKQAGVDEGRLASAVAAALEVNLDDLAAEIGKQVSSVTADDVVDALASRLQQ